MNPLTQSALGNIGQWAFNNAAAPYNDASNAYSQYASMGANAMAPYQEAGESAIPAYQNWLKTMQNPTAFNNQLMSNYQESPFAKFEQNQAVRAEQNAGSATGMVGSSPYNLQVEQNAENISGQDMNNWIQRTLGINQMYGTGEQNLIGEGENAGNSLLSLYGNEAAAQGEAAYGAGAGEQQNNSNLMSGIIGML